MCIRDRFHRSTEPEEVEIIEESGGGVLAVWGSPGCGKTVTAVKIAKHLASQKKNVALLLCDMTAPMMPCILSLIHIFTNYDPRLYNSARHWQLSIFNLSAAEEDDGRYTLIHEPKTKSDKTEE